MLDRLASDFEAAVRSFSRDTKKLKDCRASEERQYQENLMEAVAGTFQECAAAREAVLRHLKSHDCG